MPANTIPIFGRTFRNPRVLLTTGSATYDGTGVTNIFTADATNGSYFRRIFVQPRGTNVATVLRIYRAVGGANFALLREWVLPATTASSTVAATPIEIPFNLGLEPSVQISAHLSVTVAGGYDITAEVVDY